MSDNTEKRVLMKCGTCDYEEDVPQWILEESNEFSDDNTYKIICQECDHTMFEKGNMS